MKIVNILIDVLVVFFIFYFFDNYIFGDKNFDNTSILELIFQAIIFVIITGFFIKNKFKKAQSNKI